jgi:hypothetical protein
VLFAFNMRILFDQGTPAPLRHSLIGHTILTAHEEGWSTLSNGALLAAAEAANYDAMITTIKTSATSRTSPEEELPFSFCRQLAGHR